MSHTSTPWVLKMSDNGTPHIMHMYGHDWTDVEDFTSLVCHMPAEIMDSYNSLENAKFIVKACNVHDELVAALKALTGDKDYEGLMFSERAKMARDALAKASL